VKKWQRYTHNERQLAQSLEQLEAQDLSVHLFDAFSLNRRNYAKDFQDTSRKGDNTENLRQQPKPYHRKDRWLQPGAWTPGTKWTAWPLSLHDVPKEEETFTKDVFNAPADERDALLDNRRPEKSSRWLEDVVLAEALHQSRQKNYKRGIGPGDVHEDVQRKARKITDHIEEMDLDAEIAFEDHSYRKPVIMADDEKAGQILQPIIRHVLHKVDDLLMGLHHSRKNQLDFDSSDTGTDSQASRESSRIPRSRSKSAPPKTRSTSRRRGKRDGEEPYAQKYLIPRDWSEVLGIATMVGWDPEVVKRASARCSDLFGEHMVFRRMHEGAEEANTVQQPLNEAVKRRGRVTRSQSRVRSVHSEDAPTIWACPEESCPRHIKPFNARWKVHDHVKRSHHYVYSAPGSRAPSAEDGDEVMQDVTGLNGSLCCPILGCKRHDKPYASRWRLNEHIKRKHGNKRSKSIAPTSESDATMDASGVEVATSSDLSVEEMVGGVHVDGFMKPIRARKGWADSGKERKRAPGKSKGSEKNRHRFTSKGMDDDDVVEV